MSFLAIASVLCLCLSTSFATYGPDFKNHGPKPHYDGPKFNEPKIHLESPKIILDRPSINVHGSSHGPILEEEPILLENDKPLYIRKTLHGIPAAPALHAPASYAPAFVAPALTAAHPVVLDGGYSTGKVLDISAPIQVINHAPIVQERPVLIRRPVVVSKGLTATQDHLERLHYAHSGLAAHSAGYSFGDYAVPISKGLHERTVIYGGLGHGGLGHGGLGHGYGFVPAYSAPLILEQPKAFVGHADIGYGSGKALGGGALHGHGASFHAAPLKKY